MTSLVAYRPLKEKIGIKRAVIVSFLLSGLLHEIAISLPARAGYGLPLLYFLLQAIFMQFESRTAIDRRITSHWFFLHAWVMGALIIPMPLLFHQSFVSRVLVPLRQVLLPPINW